MNVIIEGMLGLTVKVGGSFITLNSGGVFITGPMVMINSGGAPLAGIAGNAVPAAVPILAAIAADAVPGKDISYQEQRHKESAEEEEKEKKSWIEIELVDEEDNPVPGERYRIEFPDGKIAEGKLDEKGFARVDVIDPGTCKITFPNLDKDAWEKV
ncbi:MAG: hypothetical protein V1753_00920 [Pseudomonadota bacterium]